MGKGFWIALVLIIAVFTTIFVFSKSEDPSSGSLNYGATTTLQEQDHTAGTGKVEIIEYGDFQCPGCGQIFPVMQQLKKERAKDIKFTFRHFPIVSTHPQAMAAHRAAEAAGRQGKFFEMHDLLYQSQASWSQNTNAATVFEGFAQQLGLNMDQYRSDLASQTVFDRIGADQESGQGLGVTSTPTFFVNGVKQEDFPTTVAEWDKLIDRELEKL